MPGPAGIKTKITQNVQDALRVEKWRKEAWESIAAKYQSLGGSSFGKVTRREFGAWYLSPGACICYNSNKKTSYEIHGAIFEKWMKLGGVSWSIPTTDESPAEDNVGRFNLFERGTSIFWHPTTGAYSAYGDIFQHWVSLGRERSYLGYPTSDESSFPEGGRANTFQHGGIYWWADTGAIDLRDVVISYKGIHCFGETDNDQLSASDEPYVVLSYSSPERADTIRSKVYDGVDAGESFTDFTELYRGKPYGIVLNTVVMEHDESNPDAYRDEIKKTVMAVHSAGVIALGLIPLVGPIIASVAGPGLGALMPTVADELHKIFDFGDDKLGASNITLNARQMVLLAARTPTSKFNDLEYKIETDLVSGEGSSYKAYFDIYPA